MPAGPPSPSPPPPPSPSPPPLPPPVATTVPFTATLAADFVTVSMNITAFKIDFSKNVATAANVDVSKVNITSVRAGSVIVDFYIITDSNTAAAITAAITPTALLTPALMASYGITGVYVTVSPSPPPPPPAPPSSASRVTAGVGIMALAAMGCATLLAML